MNPHDLPSLLYPLALLISIARSSRKLRTFLYAIAADMVATIAVMLALFFLPLINGAALTHLAGDVGRTAGIITAFLYSTKTRERTPKSVYVIAVSGAIIVLVLLIS